MNEPIPAPRSGAEKGLIAIAAAMLLASLFRGASAWRKLRPSAQFTVGPSAPMG